MKKFFLKKSTIAIILSVLFFFIGVITLPHYGINWDSINHLPRGQAYLRYILTGEKDYSKLEEWNLFKEKGELVKDQTSKSGVTRQRLYFQKKDTIFFSPDIPKEDVPRISMYQNVGNDFNFYSERDGYGHPPLSDILSSIFNFILFQKMGLINDVDSYHIYSIFLSSLLVGLVFWWVSTYYGIFAGGIAVLSLALYPLFWSESHFNNEKDIPQAVFFSFLLFSFWKGVINFNWKWIITSGIFFGLALGTKFNVLFAVFIIIPWLVLYLISRYKKELSINFFKKRYQFVISLLVAPLLGLAIFFLSWPYLWTDSINRVSKVVSFYKSIGTDSNIDISFIGPLGINSYAALWILYTTPIIILSLAAIGLVFIISKGRKERHKLSLLFLLWLLVPIARVSWPGTNIYGGVRHIMEFIPALAIISGIGASYFQTLIGQKIKSNFIATILILAFFILLVIKLIEIHPNENVYFNPLIGGLKGAMTRDFPGWGVSLGNPYRQAINWINQNVEPGAKVSFTYELPIGIPAVFLRPDLNYRNSYRSGYLREGEYLLSLIFHGSEKRSYMDMYANTMLEPLYEVNVDGVAILRVWKNDLDHTKSEWKNDHLLENIKFTNKGSSLLFDIGQVVKLSRLVIYFTEDGCSDLEIGYTEISKDGEVWKRVPGVLPEELKIQMLGQQPKSGRLIEPFAGQSARYISLFFSPEDACVAKVKNTKLYHFNETL